MDTSTRAFQIDLYLEHLEEAAFLYEQCRALRQDVAFSWRAVADFEERLEAHIDALVVGGDLALDICRRRALEGEAAELFAVVSAFCRQLNTDGLAASLTALDAAEPARVQAIEDALCLELPDAWINYCTQGVARQGALARLLTAVAGYRRLDVSQHLQPRIDGGVSECMTNAWALGRLRNPESAPGLTMLAQRPEAEVRTEVLLAMLRMGSSDALKPCYLLAQREDWPHIPMALAASRNAIDVLLSALASGLATGDTALAVGLLGDLRGVRPLLQALSVETLAASAAWGLYLITGANLFSTTFIPDEVVEDELFEDERKAWRESGQGPQRLDGKPFGSEQIALSCDPEVWSAWLKVHSAQFDPALRYRNGQPCTPRASLANLLDARMPMKLRRLVGEELCIRYECDMPFETGMPVRQQLRVLRGLARWLDQHELRFAAGSWYFSSQVLV